LWFGENSGSKIGRITLPRPRSFGAVLPASRSVASAGAISEFAKPTANGQPFDIAAGPDGALWFVEIEWQQGGQNHDSRCGDGVPHSYRR
jgi:hypothetical protein